jgi:hypothetical protein
MVTAALPPSIDPVAHMALPAVEKALAAPDGEIRPATETQIQNALHRLRLAGGEAELLRKMEHVATTFRLMADAKRDGRVNLYMSRLLRLRRELFA